MPWEAEVIIGWPGFELQGNIMVMEHISRLEGFDINANIVGFTALHAAVVQGQVEAVEWLLSHGASVKYRKEEKWQDTALHYAAANGHAEVARLLLQYNANPSMKNFQVRQFKVY